LLGMNVKWWFLSASHNLELWSTKYVCLIFGWW
jgi:hypothetical protein